MWRLRLILMSFSLLVALGMAEIVLRRATGSPAAGATRRVEGPDAIVRHDPLLGWSPIPRSRAWHEAPEFRVPLRINGHGFRADREYSYQPPPGVQRIVAVGDSYTFGHGVEVDQTFLALLERELDRTEVLNLGVSGYGVDQQLLMLTSRGFRYQPDVVLLGLYVPDIFRNDDDYHGRHAKPRFELGRDGELKLTHVPVPELTGPPPPPKGLSRSRLYHLVETKLEYRGFGDSWGLTEAILQEMDEKTQAAGARLVAVIIPTEPAVYGSAFDRWLQGQTSDRVADILRRNGIDYLDPVPSLIARAHANPEERLYYERDGHLTATGHQILGRLLRDHLQKTEGR